MEALRALPGLLLRRPAFRPDPSAPLLDQFTTGAVLLGERAGTEIVAGAIGRFWRLAGNETAHVRTREEFLSFDQSGYAKAAISFLVVPSAAAAASAQRRAPSARAQRQRERCCVTGV